MITDSIVSVILRFLVYIFFILGITQLLFIDTAVSYNPEQVEEATLTEWLQLTFLGVILFLFYLTGKASRGKKPMTTLLVGVTIAVMIREVDWFFDAYISEGVWQVLTLGVIVFFSFLAIRERQLLLNGIREFIKHPSFGIILCGFLTTFVFAPVLGSLSIWRTVMDGYLRSIAQGAEEGVELLGYSFILIGAFEFFLKVKYNKYKITSYNMK
jgi:hypothetical protein